MKIQYMQCPSCGSDIDDGIRKCPFCGAIYLGSIGKRGEPLKSRPWLVPFLLGFLFNIAGVAIAYLFYRHTRTLYEEDPTRRAVIFSMLGMVLPVIVLLLVTFNVIVIIHFQ